MHTLEVITHKERVDVPITDTTTELLDGLHDIVRHGLTDHFDDVAWLFYYGSLERMEVLSDPGFQNLLLMLEASSKQPKIADQDESTRPNILPAPDMLARNMAAKAGRGGGFWRVSSLDSQRYVAVPAHHKPNGSKERSIEINLAGAISFDGASLVRALFQTDVSAEIIDYRDEPAFPAYREVALGSFFVKHVLGDT